VLNHYPAAATEEPVKVGWVKDLRALGYRRIVFLSGSKKMEVDGLKVLEDPQSSPLAAAK